MAGGKIIVRTAIAFIAELSLTVALVRSSRVVATLMAIRLVRC